jgi:hypothetical protein
MNRVEISLLTRGKQARRRALNSPLKQGINETVKYYVDFTPWGASAALPVSTPIITVLDQDDTDVTSTIFSADDATVVSSVEVEFTLSALVINNRYRVFVKGTINSLVGECYTVLTAER